jgi:hypothetical protein
MRNKNQNLGGSHGRRWYAYLWHEWKVERLRPIAPAFTRPNPAESSDNRITAAWLHTQLHSATASRGDVPLDVEKREAGVAD